MLPLSQIKKSLRPRKSAAYVLLAAAVMILGSPVVATDHPESTISVGQMTMQLVGGLALFLFGIDQMTNALKAVAGESMRSILARLTSNRYMGAITGAFVTAVIQSSSVTTVLVVGFTTAGLLSFSQSIGIIMGANIGTTITAQIVAFKVSQIALPMIALGFALLFLSKRDKVRHYGGIIMGIGLVFFGMTIMGDAMYPLRTYQPFLDMMTSMENPFIGILVATAFTALIQSSSATTAIVIVMATQGFITLPAGIALAFGANIGTCVTALLAAIGKPREAIRAAATHILFNVAGVLLWLGFVDQLAALVTLLSPSHPELAGNARLAAETPRQIANAHTLFNVANTLIFIWFTTPIARFVEWLIPDRSLDEENIIAAKYLDHELLSTPTLALDLVRMEIRRMGKRVEKMLAGIMPAILQGSVVSMMEIRAQDEYVDGLHAHIVLYLGAISRQELTESQTTELMQLMAISNDLENIGDVIETNLVDLGCQRIKKGVSVSQPTRDMLGKFHDVVTRSVVSAIQSVVEKNPDAAAEVQRLKKEIKHILRSAATHEAKRLVANEPHRIEAYTIEMDITEKLQRIYYFANRIAKTVSKG